jgi:hypothetical protein
MEYETNITVTGDTSQALDAAAAALETHGLKLTSRTGSSIQLSGAASACNLKKHPLRAISEMTIHAFGNTISAKAELGGISRVLKILLLLFLADIASTVVVAVILSKQQPKDVLPVIAMMLLPFPAVIPLTIWGTRRAVRGALDRVLRQAAAPLH